VNLDFLDLNLNKIGGNIPSSLANLTRLMYLDPCSDPTRMEILGFWQNELGCACPFQEQGGA
jgi:hypothetical protein